MNRRLLGGGLGALGLVVLSLSSRAEASGYLSARFGADHGQPAMPNAYAIYFNPAALGGTEGTTIVLDGSIAIRSVTYTRSEAALSPSNESFKNDENYRRANTGNAKLLNVIPLPFVGISSDLGTKNLRVGFATYIPFGGVANWSENKSFAGFAASPGAIDGPQRWHNMSGLILAVYNTAALAYRFESARLTIGASFSGIFHEVKTVRARNIDGTDDVRTANGGLKEGRSLLEATGFNFAAAIGLYWEPLADRSLRLGLSYSSQPGFGTTRMKGELLQQFGTTAAVAAPQKVDLLQAYPDVVRLGATYRASPKIEVRVDGEYVRWSTFKNQCVVQTGTKCDVLADGSDPNGNVVLNIPREWKDAIGVRAGLAYFVRGESEIFASGGFTTSAVPKTTIDPSTIDSFRIYASIGTRIVASKHLAIGASYNHIFFVPVDTNGVSKHDNYLGASKSPSSDGKYSAFIGFFNLNAAYTF